MRVLVVEDDPDIRSAVAHALRRESMAVDTAADGTQAMRAIEETTFDVIVLDRDIPAPDGDEIARQVADSGTRSRILMLTAASRLDDKETGFGLGADDYVTKPFAVRELVLRIRALARRAVDPVPVVHRAQDLEVDAFRRTVVRHGRELAVTRKQFAVLEVLLAARGGVVSAEELLARAWDENADPFSNPIRMTISSLRKRLGAPPVIETVPGAGYRIRPVEDEA